MLRIPSFRKTIITCPIFVSISWKRRILKTINIALRIWLRLTQNINRWLFGNFSKITNFSYQIQFQYLTAGLLVNVFRRSIRLFGSNSWLLWDIQMFWTWFSKLTLKSLLHGLLTIFTLFKLLNAVQTVGLENFVIFIRYSMKNPPPIYLIYYLILIGFTIPGSAITSRQ